MQMHFLEKTINISHASLLYFGFPSLYTQKIQRFQTLSETRKLYQVLEIRIKYVY